MPIPLRRSMTTKLLHGALALCVLHQLLLVSLVEAPEGPTAGNTFFEIHRIVGLTALAVLLAFWAWLARRRLEPGITALVPWFTARGRAAVHADLGEHLATLRQRRLPEIDEGHSALAAAIHGLGLLAVTLMAVTGGLFAWFGHDSGVGGVALEIHQMAANLLWAYLIGHVGMAFVHLWLGQPVLHRMFGRRRG